MILREAGLHGSYVAEPEPIEDDRGFFARVWDDSAVPDGGTPPRFVQTNVSFNRRRGTTRGLHWQVEPYAEAKLVRCTAGSVFDAAVDLRPGSPTYGQWQGVVLSAARRNVVLVPAGCAHGYQALEDGAEVFYGVSHAYVPGAERGLRWDDPSIGIEWPIRDEVIVSAKDAAWPDIRLEVDR